jgi:predicted AlkP superfamily pyrophosphatase or phosphodiesterase
VEGELIDIAPTAAAALGIPAPDIALGQILREGRADQVLLLFLDGFGYLRFQEAEAAGLVPVLSGLDPPLLGLTTYPPITTVSTASLLTGAPPSIHGVETRGIRKTEQKTLLDAAAAAGLEAAAVEGEALAFQLRGASFQLSGDRDGDGGTDDNVLSNALEVISGGMPDLLLVHFHGIDDLGHQYGPGAPEEQAKIQEIDRAVGEIFGALPPGTLVMIFADHGMHQETGSDRVGNHRHLIERDMLIPMWIANVP